MLLQRDSSPTAIQKQVQGDDRKLGDILIDLGIITVADLTDAMLEYSA